MYLAEQVRIDVDESPVRKVLLRAIEIIKTSWTQDELAVTEDGEACEPEYAKAHMFCAVGSIWRASWELELNEWVVRHEAQELLGKYIEKTWGYASIEAWNDHEDRKKGEVIQAFEDVVAQQKRW